MVRVFRFTPDPFDCGRHIRPQRLATGKHRSCTLLGKIKPSCAQPIPVVRIENGARHFTLMRWGLIPRWAKDVKVGFSSINARAETVDTAPAFREAWKKSQRCLVITDGFYEWKKPEKQPYAVAMADDQFMVVTGAAAQTRDFAWLKRHIPDGAHCIATDVTSGLPMLSVMGPKSRPLLQLLSGADLSNAEFPFGRSKEIEIGYARVRASRITYVGELGWELYIPAEFAAHVFETIWDAGAEFGLKPAGMHTMNNARVEKAYRHWGHDIADEDTPLEAGLSFAVAFKKNGFIGRNGLEKHRRKNVPLKKRMIALALHDSSDAAPMIYHEEPIYRDGKIVGSTTSGAWGHRVDRSLGLGYIHNSEGVTQDWLASADWEIELAWQRFPIKVQFESFYDPKGERIRT
jgi:heterotetrameric sarcosine oxidase gamma subunit